MGIQIRYGMVGGHMNAFIGEVHRKAIAFDPRAQLVAGCFSTNAEKNRETGETYSLDMSRVYPSYEAMAEAESRRPDGIDFVSITTPNNTHYDVAKCFLQHGIHVVCEKPLCFTVEQAQELVALAKEKNLVFGVTYTYSGYTMMKVAREMIAEARSARSPPSMRSMSRSGSSMSWASPARAPLSCPSGAPIRRCPVSPTVWATSAPTSRTPSIT